MLIFSKRRVHCQSTTMSDLLDFHFFHITSLEDQLAVACAKKKMLSSQLVMCHLQASKLDQNMASLGKIIKTLDDQIILTEGTVSIPFI